MKEPHGKGAAKHHGLDIDDGAYGRLRCPSMPGKQVGTLDEYSLEILNSASLQLDEKRPPIASICLRLTALSPHIGGRRIGLPGTVNQLLSGNPRCT